ncbi:MAG: glycosyltransferase family 2 protein [bacterium]|nr:glycosyltransferase family 2 protein [bacterium]
MINNKKIVVFIPAYNTEKTIQKTLDAIPNGVVDQIIVVNDGSKDKTEEIARKNNVTLINHPQNRGYGAAQKTGYTAALAAGADVVVMVHSDFQYDPTLVTPMAARVANGEADVCFGSRMHDKGSARKGGMPLWRFVANKGLTLVEDSVFKLGLTEYHTGYRAYGRKLLQQTSFDQNSDNYVFDTEMFAEISLGKFRVAEIPIPTRYMADSQSPSFYKSCEYGVMTLQVLARFLMHSWGLKKYPQFVIKTENKTNE